MARCPLPSGSVISPTSFVDVPGSPVPVLSATGVPGGRSARKRRSPPVIARVMKPSSNINCGCCSTSPL